MGKLTLSKYRIYNVGKKNALSVVIKKSKISHKISIFHINIYLIVYVSMFQMTLDQHFRLHDNVTLFWRLVQDFHFYFYLRTTHVVWQRNTHSILRYLFSVWRSSC